MCLAIPMRVVDVQGGRALCACRGAERDVELLWLLDEEVVPGDLLLVHAGRAHQKVSEQEARRIWALFDEILRHEGDGVDTPQGLSG